MNFLTLITALRNLSEDQKKILDSAIDKLEDMKKPGSIEDIGIEMACQVLRQIINVPDYPDDKTVSP